MTEPTADEINRAIAEWMGWRLEAPSPFGDQPFSRGIPPDATYGSPIPEEYTGIPDYTASLDAQIPVIAAVKVATGKNLWLQEAGDTHMAVFDGCLSAYGSSLAEASARALYAAITSEDRGGSAESRG